VVQFTYCSAAFTNGSDSVEMTAENASVHTAQKWFQCTVYRCFYLLAYINMQAYPNQSGLNIPNHTGPVTEQLPSIQTQTLVRHTRINFKKLHYYNINHETTYFAQCISVSISLRTLYVKKLKTVQTYNSPI